MPALFVLYTLSFLDRANIGNAKAGGMGADLKLTPNQYSIILLIFFVRPPVCVENIKKLRPPVSHPILSSQFLQT